MSVSDFDPGFLLLIPSAIGYMKTRINYDILSYLRDRLKR